MLAAVLAWSAGAALLAREINRATLTSNSRAEPTLLHPHGTGSSMQKSEHEHAQHWGVHALARHWIVHTRHGCAVCTTSELGCTRKRTALDRARTRTGAVCWSSIHPSWHQQKTHHIPDALPHNYNTARVLLLMNRNIIKQNMQFSSEVQVY